MAQTVLPSTVVPQCPHAGASDIAAQVNMLRIRLGEKVQTQQSCPTCAQPLSGALVGPLAAFFWCGKCHNYYLPKKFVSTSLMVKASWCSSCRCILSLLKPKPSTPMVADDELFEVSEENPLTLQLSEPRINTGRCDKCNKQGARPFSIHTLHFHDIVQLAVTPSVKKNTLDDSIVWYQCNACSLPQPQEIQGMSEFMMKRMFYPDGRFRRRDFEDTLCISVGYAEPWVRRAGGTGVLNPSQAQVALTESSAASGGPAGMPTPAVADAAADPSAHVAETQTVAQAEAPAAKKARMDEAGETKPLSDYYGKWFWCKFHFGFWLPCFVPDPRNIKLRPRANLAEHFKSRGALIVHYLPMDTMHVVCPTHLRPFDLQGARETVKYPIQLEAVNFVEDLLCGAGPSTWDYDRSTPYRAIETFENGVSHFELKVIRKSVSVAAKESKSGNEGKEDGNDDEEEEEGNDDEEEEDGNDDEEEEEG